MTNSRRGRRPDGDSPLFVSDTFYFTFLDKLCLSSKKGCRVSTVFEQDE